MNVRQQSPRIVTVSSLVGFAEIQGLVHTVGGVEANNTGFSSEKQIKMSNWPFLETVVPVDHIQFLLMKHHIFLQLSCNK